MIYYFAYASNLHPMRLMGRVASATLIGTIKLTRYKLIFHKKSIDGSSKCNLLETGEPSDHVYGAIYELDPQDKNDLDQFEGKGAGYIDTPIQFQLEGVTYDCFTYIAQQSHIVNHLKPYHWYKDLVIIGAKFLQFPEAYVLSIESIESWDDPNKDRALEKESFLKTIMMADECVSDLSKI